MQKNKEFNVKAELCSNLSKVDLQELCDATEEAIKYHIWVGII